MKVRTKFPETGQGACEVVRNDARLKRAEAYSLDSLYIFECLNKREEIICALRAVEPIGGQMYTGQDKLTKALSAKPLHLKDSLVYALTYKAAPRVGDYAVGTHHPAAVLHFQKSAGSCAYIGL